MGLPDCNETRSTLIALQATIQSKNLKDKIRKSIVGIDTHISHEKNILFVLINPSWTDFEHNYEASVEATTGAAAAR